MKDRPCIYKRLRRKFAGYEASIRREQGRAIETQRQNDRLQGKVNDLERELRNYRSTLARRRPESRTDHIELCMRLEMHTLRECPAMLDTALTQLRADFIKEASRR